MNNTLPKLTKTSDNPAVIKSVCVFCASSMGADPLYAQEAESKKERKIRYIT